ncbi:unnamed protein product, partial [Hapterophycus canaliculatus]
MMLLEDIVTTTSQGGVFHGFPLRKLLCLVASLARHEHMRVHRDGRRTNQTQRRLFEQPYLAHHDLSYPQYEFLVAMFEGSELQGFGATLEECFPEPSPSVATEPAFVDRYFACDFGPICCGKYMIVRELEAVAHTISKSFAAKHVTKRCTGAWRSALYLNKRTYHEELGQDGVLTHTFYP